MKEEKRSFNPNTQKDNSDRSNKLNAVPEKLRDYRFCKVIGKRPFEDEWASKPYSIDDPEFELWLKNGNNYGVLGGYNGLWPWDFDSIEARHLLLEYLPETFQVKSRRGSHHYFRANEKELFTAGVNWKGTRAIDITGFGRQVVGPGSIHPESHKPYFVIADIEIAYLDAKEARKILHDILGWEAEETSVKIPRPQGHNHQLNLDRLINALEPYWNANGGTYFNFTGAVAGYLAWNRATQEDAEYVISELCNRTGKGCDRIRDVKFVFNSYKNPEKHVMGEPTLMQIIKDLEGKI